MIMEERKEMLFGKRYRAGNFEYIKITRTITKCELRALREQDGIPEDVQRHLRRGGLPYMVVSTIGGGWSISFACGTLMYRFIDSNAALGEEGTHALTNLFTLMYSDTAVVGDEAYWKAKADALKAFIERQEAAPVSDEENAAELESLKAEEAARENLKDIVSNLNEESHD